MDHYADVLILPDPEFPVTVLMSALYTKLHKALCDLNSTSVGVSFPKYNVTLGNVLRIHGDEPTLKNIQNKNWVGGMSGYCRISDTKQVPADVKFRTISRKQATMNIAKLKRLQKRGSITEEEVKIYKAKMVTKELDNPYVELESGSNGHRHRRYIEFGELLDESVTGPFDQFGLSRTTTVPWF